MLSIVLVVMLTSYTFLDVSAYAKNKQELPVSEVVLKISEKEIQAAIDSVEASNSSAIDPLKIDWADPFLSPLELELVDYSLVASGRNGSSYWAIGVAPDHTIKTVYYNGGEAAVTFSLLVESKPAQLVDWLTGYTVETAILTQEELDELNPLDIIEARPISAQATASALGYSGVNLGISGDAADPQGEVYYETSYLIKQESIEDIQPSSMGVGKFQLAEENAVPQSTSLPTALPLLQATATGFEGVYDGNEHGIIVDAPAETTITYGIFANDCTLSSSPTYCNVGTYPVYYQVTKPGFAIASGSAMVVVTPAQALPATAIGFIGAYDGKPHNILVNAPVDATVSYGTKSGAYTLSQSPEYIKAGMYTVYFQVTHENYQPFFGSAKIDITRNPVPFTAYSYMGAYDGQSHSIEVTIPESCTITYGTSKGDYTMQSPPVFTQVGIYTVFFTMGNFDYYTWTTGSATVTIKPSATLSMPLTYAGYQGTYDGVTHGITMNAPEGSTISYGTKQGEFTLDHSPLYANVGTYTVYFQVENLNYKTVTGSESVIIEPAASRPVTAAGYTGIYDGLSHSITVDAPLGSTIKYGLSGNAASNSNNYFYSAVGTYTIYYQVINPNYTTVFGNATISILPSPNLPVTAIGFIGAYDGKPHSILVNAPVDATVSYGTKSGAYTLSQSPEYVKAGVYTVYYQVTHENYEPFFGSAKIDITRNPVPFTAYSYMGAYDGQSHSIEVTIPESCTITYGTSKGDYTMQSPPVFTQVGIYTVFFTMGNFDYYTWTTGSATVTIKPSATLPLTYAGYQGTYDGVTHGITVNAPEGSTISYGTKQEEFTLDHSPLYANVGTNTVYFQVENLNYKTVTGSESVIIEPAASRPVTAAGYTGIYDGLPHSITVDAPLGSTIKYGLSGNAASNSNNYFYSAVGTYTIYYQVINPNYTTVFGNATISILPSPNLPVTAIGYFGAYDGRIHGITVAAPADALVQYGTEEGVFPFSQSPEYTNTGTYTVYYRVSCSGYESIIGAVTIRIVKKNAYINVHEATKSYGAADPTFTGTITGLVAPFDLGTIRYDRVAADNNKPNVDDDITITALYTANSNYTVFTANAKLLIVSATTMEITASGYIGDYDGKPHGITVSAPSQAVVTFGLSQDHCVLSQSPFYTNVGIHTIYFQVTRPGYQPVTSSANVHISTKNVYITVQEATKSYGAADPAFTGTITGLIAPSDLGTIRYDRVAADKNKTNVGDNITITAFYTDDMNYTVDLSSAKLTIQPISGLSVSAIGFEGTYDGVYDGQPHRIIITAPVGSTIKYGTTAGMYTLTGTPVYTTAGNYIVYYQVTNPNYISATGSMSFTIIKRDLTVTAKSASFIYDRKIKTLSGIASIQGLASEHVLNGVTTNTINQWMIGSYPLLVDIIGWNVTFEGENVTANYRLIPVNGTLTINPPSYTPSTTNGTSSPGTDPSIVPAGTITITDPLTPKANQPGLIRDNIIPKGSLPQTGASKASGFLLEASLLPGESLLRKMKKWFTGRK